MERRLFQVMPEIKLGKIVRELQLSPALWALEVTPPPSLEDPGLESLRKQMGRTLQSLGVVPGSTLHFRRA
jgi:hypothetical protein